MSCGDWVVCVVCYGSSDVDDDDYVFDLCVVIDISCVLLFIRCVLLIIS